MNPIIPGSIRDRTGSTSLLRKAIADINRRFRSLQRDVLTLFDSVSVLAVNDERDYFYRMTPDQLARLSAALAEALARWIADGRDPANSFWWSTYVEDASQLGTAQSVANLSNLSAQYAATRSLATIIYSDPYKVRLGMAQLKSYEHWTGLSASLKSDLSQVIGRAVIDGKNPKAVRKEIMERLDVSKSRAEQYAQTDITDTLRQARMAESDHAAQELGLKIGLLWTSAFLPTTRESHAARSGHVYTSNEVRAFYSVNGNRYRCHCGVTECLLDVDGKPILTDRLRDQMKNERRTWQSQRG